VGWAGGGRGGKRAAIDLRGNRVVGGMRGGIRVRKLGGGGGVVVDDARGGSERY